MVSERLRSKQPILSTSTTSSSPQVLLATSQPRIQDNRNNRDRDARNENKTEICRNFGRGYCRWGTNCRFIHASPKGTNNPRPNSSQHNTRSMQQGPGHIGLNSASQQHLLSLIQAQQNLLAQYGLSISQGQQPVQHNNTMGLRPNAPPGFQQTQPHQPTFGFNGHQQALYSAAVQNQSASSGSTSQETQLPHAFNTLTLQDPANSNWNMDTGASSHLNSSVNNLSTIFNSRIYPSVLVGDGKSIPVTNTGHSTLPTPYRTLHLNNVLITPNIVKNLISVRQFVRENKCTIEFDEFGFSVKDFWTRQILLRCDSTGDLYPVTSPSYPQAFLVGQQTWHQRLGHPGSEVLRSLVSNNLISCNKTQSSVLCHACQLGKHVRLPFSLSETIVKAPFDIIHSDLWTSPITSVSGIKYYVLFLDHFSHYLWVYPLRHKSDVLSKFIHFRAYVKNHFNCDIKSLQCDHGGEFDNTALHQLFVTNGISIRFSCPKTSQQNGKSERMIRTINNMIRTLLFQAHLPPTFWVEALHMAAYLLNILPSTAINNEIPHTRLFKTTPNYADLRVFGCLCYPHLHTNHKLEPRATPAIFLGYPTNHRGYRCLDLNTNKIILSRHVTFDETVFPYGSMTPHDSPSYTFLDTSPNIIHQHIISKLTSASPLPTTTITSTAAPPSPPRSPLQPAHQTHESSPLPHSPNVQPTSNASTETTIPTHNHNNPTSTHPMVTRFRVGTNRPTQRFNLHVSTISPIPKSYPIAFRDPNWYRAMLDEYTALIKNNTWILVPRPPDANIVRSMWLFRHKYNADGTLSRYKARLVANGSTQLAGIDVDETFSPVVKPATIRTVLSLAISRHWPVHQLDVKNAFLHGSLSETVYMHQPPGFRDPQHPDHVCLLQRSLYGLKQAPRAWFQRFAAYAARVGFHHSRCDSSLFIYRQGADTAYLLLYVDDIVLTASSSDLLQQIITSLHAEFSMTDLGSLNYFLGISVTRNASGMFLSQQKYATEVLDRAGMLNCKPCRTPVDTDSKLSADGAPISDSTLYRSLAGALQYLTFTRPDISYAVQQVCLFMHDPREPHLSALKRILRYVRGTLSYGLQLYSSTTSSLVAYSDADWAGCPTTRRSTSGYCVFLGNNLLSWSSKRQFTLSRSSAEAEYRGVANAVAETCWLRNLLRELHTPLATATLVYCDNVSAVYLSSNPVQHQRTKHIEIDIHFVRDLVAIGAIRVLHVPSRYQYADIFTKGLPTSLFDEFRTSLSVRSSPAPIAGGFLGELQDKMAVVAQNTNNTTLRSILQQEKLTGPNFTNWFRNLRIILRSKGKQIHLEQPLTPLSYRVVSQTERDAYEALYDAQNEVACLILGSMSPELQRTLENYKAYDMIQELKTMFEEQAKQELFETVKAFYACKQEDGHVRLILNSLNKDYDQFVQNYNMHSMGKTIAELHVMLKLHEKGIPKKAETPDVLAIREGKIQKHKKKPQRAKGQANGKNKLAYAPKTKIPPPPKRDNLVKDSICHHCKEVGYWRRNCPSYHTELKKRKNAGVTSSSGIFTIELCAISNNAWVYDTGYGTHICNTSQGFRSSKKLKHGALHRYMGNKMLAAVKAIRSFDLILHSGLIIVLDNCHYAPTVTKGIVLISCLVKNGYIYTFMNYGISISKDNVFYFNAILHDDIYEIDMHNLYPNISSNFNISNKRTKYSLDSYDLWHFRLGHINKKRMDMLQHDGLLQPTHDESHKK
ncbi:ribonuclease H-like domain-containing protein [Tanacetum coccineum]